MSAQPIGCHVLHVFVALFFGILFSHTYKENFDWKTGKGRVHGYYAYGVVVTQVEVDCLTGSYTVRILLSAFVMRYSFFLIKSTFSYFSRLSVWLNDWLPGWMDDWLDNWLS